MLGRMVLIAGALTLTLGTAVSATAASRDIAFDGYDDGMHFTYNAAPFVAERPTGTFGGLAVGEGAKIKVVVSGVVHKVLAIGESLAGILPPISE